MKMSDVFKSELLPSHIRVKSTPIKSSMDDSVVAHEFICGAVNNHDKLTGRVKELESLVESSFREGYSSGYGDGNSDGQSYAGRSCRDDDGEWLNSDAKQLLEKE